MKRIHIAAIVLVVIIIAGSVGVYLLFIPPPTPNVIIMGTTDSVESSLDMAQSYDYFGWEIIGSLSSGLVQIEPGSEAGPDDIEPALANSWTSSAGGTIWDFNLREDVTFDGVRPFNATDVKYTFDRNCNLTGSGLAEPDGPQLNMGYADIINNVTITGEFSVRFNLHIPFAPFLQLMACQASFMVDRAKAPMDELVSYTEGDADSSHPNALGPFILESWTRVGGSDEEMRLVRNPYYWDAASGLPMTDTIIIRFYASDSALALAMTAGEVDIAYRQLTAQQINTFRGNPDVRVWDGIGAQIQYLCFQQNIYPYNETPVRQAITAALNRTNVCETVFLGDFSPLYSMVPEGMAFHKPSFEMWGEANYTYTIAALDPYGYNATDPLHIDLYYENSGHYPQSAEQAAVYKTDLEASGVITVTLHGLEWATYRTQRNAGTMPVFIYGWYPDYIDADNYLFLPFASWLNLGYNETYPAGGVAQYNLWVDGRSATTTTGRETAYHDLQDLQADECSVVPLWQSGTVAVTKLTIHGVVLDISVMWRHWLLYIGAPATSGP
ncbi:MAG: ABC transporter substrate-binding protein [Candidatus Thorarchaeota archaeon]